MSTRSILALIGGIVVTAFLFSLYGLRDVLNQAGDFSYGYIWISLAHIVPMLFSVGGWRALSIVDSSPSGPPSGPPSHPPSGPPSCGDASPLSWMIMTQARWIREGVNNLLPVAQIGGEIVGARWIRLHNRTMAQALACTIADLTVEAGTQILFTIIAVLALIAIMPVSPHLLGTVVFGIVIATVAIGGFILAQKKGLLRLGENAWGKIMARLGRASMPAADDSSKSAHHALIALYRQRRAWMAGVAWHLGAWIIGSGEVWLVFFLMGHPIDPIDALILEGLVQAARSAAFFIPAAVGVQEGSYIAIGALFGLTPATAFAASLIRRGRDIILGVPALAFWYWSERHHAIDRSRSDS